MVVLIFLFVVVLLPVAIFHYEAYDEVEVRGKQTGNCGACYRSTVTPNTPGLRATAS